MTSKIIYVHMYLKSKAFVMMCFLFIKLEDILENILINILKLSDKCGLKLEGLKTAIAIELCIPLMLENYTNRLKRNSPKNIEFSKNKGAELLKALYM